MIRAASALLVLAACQDSVTTPFPPGLEPFDDGEVPGELPDERDEVLRVKSDRDDMIRVYGRGFIHAPPVVVWEQTKLPEAMVARCNTSEQTVTPDNEPEHELSFLVHYFVDDILDVEWDDQWRGDVIAGVSAAPEHAMIKHQKIQGSDFISVSEGTIELRATEDPGVTELRFVEHLDAISGSVDDVAGKMRFNFDTLVSLAHGGSIPACP